MWVEDDRGGGKVAVKRIFWDGENEREAWMEGGNERKQDIG